MKVVLIVAGILLSLTCVYATDVCGNISGTWTLAGSPYRVTCDVTVPNGQTLEIQPGVQVVFVGRFLFLVNGTLNAHGTEADSVRFTIDTVAYPTKWVGLRLVNANNASVISYCIVENAYWSDTNPATAGGGITCWECSPLIEHSSIRRCRSARAGGGVTLYNSNSPIRWCRIANNYAPYGGGVECGAATGTLSQPVFQRCVIERNGAGQGGGIGCWNNSSITVTNCTIANNHGNDAGGIRLCGGALAAITNSIIYGNTIRAVSIQSGASATITYSCLPQNSVNGNVPAGLGDLVTVNSNLDPCDVYYNIVVDPAFVNSAAGDYHLQETSACINAGDHATPYDPDGTVVEMGAYYRATYEGHTTVSGNISGTWTPANSPYYVISDVTVPTGQTLEIQPGVDVIFAGGYQLLVNGTLNAHGTETDSILFTIDTLAYPGKWLGIRLVNANNASVISYCRVEFAYWPNEDLNTSGGGISCLDCGPLIEHSTIQYCRSAGNGGGLVLINSNAQVLWCRVANNYGLYGGGVAGSTLVGNPAHPTLKGCLIEHNTAGQGGGIGWWTGTGLVVTNCTIAYNHGDDAGGIRLCCGATATIKNSIFSDNTIAAVATDFNSSVQMTYSCFWQNSATWNVPAGFGNLVAVNSNLDPCDVYYNIFLDPSFVDGAAGDYQLQAGSPCVNGGDHTPPLDPDGTVADMGAFYRSMFTGGTEVHGNLSGIWTPANSPYYVTGNVTVPTGQTLEIQPGVEVIFGGRYQFLVNGTLNAHGTVTDSILFSIDTLAYPVKWLGLRLEGASNASVISYCRVEFAYWPNEDANTSGGGITCRECSPLIEHSTIQYCRSVRNGGGVVLFDSNAQVLWCRIVNNYGLYGGGVVGGAEIGHATQAAINGCVIEHNTAGQGGGIGWWVGTGLTVTNCTIASNHGDDAGGIRLCCGATATIKNSIFSDNTIAAVATDFNSSVQMTYSCFWQNSATWNVPAGFGNLVAVNSNLDPCDVYYNIFLNPNFMDGAAGDYQLQAGSPCVNAGDHTPPLDPDGTVADMGAFYRSMFTGGTEVSGNISGTWIPAHSPYYVTSDVTVPTGQTLEIQPGVEVIFGGHYQFLVNGTLNAHGTVTDSILFSIDTLAYPVKWSGIRLVGASNASVISYCRVENAYWSNSNPNTVGGGIACWDCSPLIERSTIQYCSSAWNGGGIVLHNSNAQILRCRIANNYSPYGGGLQCGADVGHVTQAAIRGCVIEHNTAGQGGGIGCWIRSAITVTNCTIVNNHGDDAGGIRLCGGASAMTTNSIFSGNTIGAVAIYDNSTSVMTYSCFWQNSVSGNVPAGFGNLVMENGNSDPCDIYYNIFLNPSFVDGAAGDYHLQAGSPCINAGDPNTQNDPDGTVADMGAYYRSIFTGDISFATLISAGPPNWAYRLHCTAGTVSRVVFTGFCTGTTGSVSGAAAATWQVMSNGDGNNGDSIIFLASTPMSIGTLDTFKLSNSTCAGQILWWATDSSSTVDGPAPGELLNFIGTSKDGRVTLLWSTARETNVASFEILRDGVPIMSIPSSGGSSGGADYLRDDTGLINGQEYHYALAEIGLNGERKILAQTNSTPVAAALMITEYALDQNYPNPFNPRTTISFDLVEAGHVTLTVFNIMGQKVESLVDGQMAAGRHLVSYDAAKLPSGLYIYRLNVNGYTSEKKMLLMK